MAREVTRMRMWPEGYCAVRDDACDAVSGDDMMARMLLMMFVMVLMMVLQLMMTVILRLARSSLGFVCS